MTNTLIQNAHLPAKQVKILLDLLKIQFKRGCIDWNYQRIADHYGVCRDVIKRLFAYLKKFDLLDTIRQGATRFLKIIKQDVFDYLNTPLDWLKKKNLYTKKAPSLAPSLAPSPAPSFQGEISPDTYKKKEREESTVQNLNMEEAVAEAITEHQLFIPIKSVEKAKCYYQNNPGTALKNLLWMESELQKLKFTHIKQAISGLLHKNSLEASMMFGATSDTLTFGNEPTAQKTALHASDWKDFITSILKTFGKEHQAAQIISSLEAQINQNVQSDIEIWKKRHANRKQQR